MKFVSFIIKLKEFDFLRIFISLPMIVRRQAIISLTLIKHSDFRYLQLSATAFASLHMLTNTDGKSKKRPPLPHHFSSRRITSHGGIFIALVGAPHRAYITAAIFHKTHAYVSPDARSPFY